MGFLEFLKFALLCIDFLVWPVFALGYPLCASIRAIETGSKYHMRKLVIYWTLFSLISLFELAFIKLIEWIPFWSCIKLVAICWLVIPGFNGACHVYQRLMNPCLSVNLRAFISQLCRPNEEQPPTTETLLAVMERYIKENDVEAFEKLMASKLKNKELDNVQKDIQQLESTDKIDAATIEQPKCKEPEVAQKDITALEPTEKIALTPAEQIQHADAKIAETILKEEAHGRLPEIPVKKVQREWTCALCQVTTTSEKTLNMHLRGSKHKSKCEALKISKQDMKSRGSSPSAPNKSKHENLGPEKGKIGEKSKQKPEEIGQPSTPNKSKQQNLNLGPEKGKIGEKSKQKPEEIGLLYANQDQQFQEQTKRNVAWINQTPNLQCNICNVKMTSEIDLASHLRGRKHSFNIQNMFDSYVTKGVVP